MFGAVIGDLVGSVYEWHNHRTKEFPLFREDCFFTDDTVMTCAVADAILKGGTRDDFIDSMKTYGRRYPDAGYGGKFQKWLLTDDREPYNSFGNGSAMRVSPCAWAADWEWETWTSEGRKLVRLSAAVTHSHPEGVKGALATADAIVLCRTGCVDPDACRRRVRSRIKETYGYDLSRTLDEIRPTYRFCDTCQESVPEAIIAFLESTDFEDAIRNAVSLGGDSDTIAAIAGSIAEAAYGIPEWIKEKAWSYLDEPLRDVLRRWELRANSR